MNLFYHLKNIFSLIFQFFKLFLNLFIKYHYFVNLPNFNEEFTIFFKIQLNFLK